MSRTLVALALAVVLLGAVAGAISVAPTASQFSDSATVADNHVGAADDWGIALAVDDGGDDLEITATVTNEHRHAETVTVGLEVGNESETERVSLEGGESASVTFAIGADDLDAGEHTYVVTAGDERVEGTVTVDDGDDGDAADGDEEGADGDGDLGDEDDTNSDDEDGSEADESHGGDSYETGDSSEEEN